MRVEFRLASIENTNAQPQETIADVNDITDGFKLTVDRIDEVEDRLNAQLDERFAQVNRRFDLQDARFDSHNAKLDIIIRQMTGMGQVDP